MVRFRNTFFACYVCFVLIKVIGSDTLAVDIKDVSKTAIPAADFSHHTVIRPHIYHGRSKREVAHTKGEDGLHIHDLTVGFNIEGRDLVLDLQLNRDLIPKSYFEKYQHQGRHVINRPTGKDVQLCQYKGNLRGVADSWAAISTCDGLSGVIFDGEELHYVEPGAFDADNTSGLGPHYLYRHEHLQTNQTCGFPDTPHHILDSGDAHRILRFKRNDDTTNAGVIRGPYNANKQSRYVELVLVVDTKEYIELGGVPQVALHCKKIANIINALYVPLNIFVALVGVVVWTELDDIVLSPNGDTTLANFLHYRRGRLAKEHPNDNAQLLTRMQFDGGVVGKALKGPICTYEFSGGVSVDHSSVVGLVATTVAHEMGHNFGMEHDTSDCTCPSDRCIMAPSSNSRHPTHWSSCSLEYLAHAFEHGMDYCLRNKPERLFESPVCGNGFVEAGEQCDCGLPEFCNNPCCNASSCMLFSNASCATGECCDLSRCMPRRAGYMCRTADHECDLPEFCTGESEYCPNNVFKMDGEKCYKGKAFCYHGSCRTHSDQCRLLWGPSGLDSDPQCYHMNTKGSQHGNCGYNRLNHSYIRCVNDDILCGMLHCKHLNEQLEFGMESVAILSQTFLNTGGSIIPCRTAIVDLGLNEVDPGLAPDGARCGDGKMCVNQRCLSVASLQMAACPNNCHGRGICNSKGHCHCEVGYAPPYCNDIGFGGSDDSGPASDPNAESSTTKLLIFLFAMVFMFLVLLLVVFYTRYWRNSKSSGATVTTSTSHGRTEKDTGRAMEISSPLSPSDSAHASLLTNSSEPVLNGLLGQHKGFSISPLQAAASSGPTASPVVPAAAAVAVPVHSNVVATKPTAAVSRPVVNTRPVAVVTRPAPSRPPVVINDVGRPTISSPVLEATTSTAHELISSAIPTTLPQTDSKVLRQAPAPPTSIGYTALAISSPTKPRPLSSPNVLVPPEPTVVPNVKVTREGTSALSRIASIFHTNSRNNSNKPKLDREALRNIQISKPIPQKEIEIPGSKTVSTSENRPVVMRAHSLRDEGPVTPRPNIPNFGSMRGARRPLSIPSNRPTSPPPRPPPPKSGTSEANSTPSLEYDDCLNVQNTAPLANIDEEAGSPVDNIYAVIEECPPLKSPVEKTCKPTSKQEYTSPTGEYQAPRPVENSISAGSSESVGLLSEIVSEMHARNMESIYTSTLGRKRKKKDGQGNENNPGESEDESKGSDEISPSGKKHSALKSGFPDRASSISTSNSSLGTYVNAPYTSNRPGQGGLYTNVSSRNSPTPSQGSSQAGYLSPKPVLNSPPALPAALPVVSTSASSSANTFSTFKTPMKNFSEVKPKNTLISAPTPAPYKPFNSSFDRSSGPLSLNKGGLAEKKAATGPATFERPSGFPTNIVADKKSSAIEKQGPLALNSTVDKKTNSVTAMLDKPGGLNTTSDKKSSGPTNLERTSTVDQKPIVGASNSKDSAPAIAKQGTPSSAVVKSVLAAVENSKKVDIPSKALGSRSASFTDRKPPSQNKTNDTKLEKAPISMANRPLPEKPTTANKIVPPRKITGPITAVKPPTAPLASPEKSTPTVIRSKFTGNPQKTAKLGAAVVQNKSNKIPPTPPSPKSKPNKSSPDVVVSCGREQGSREPDVVSPATSPPHHNGGSKPGLRQSGPPRLSHVASLQHKFESAALDTSRPTSSNSSKQTNSLQDNAKHSNINK